MREKQEMSGHFRYDRDDDYEAEMIHLELTIIMQ